MREKSTEILIKKFHWKDRKSIRPAMQLVIEGASYMDTDENMTEKNMEQKAREALEKFLDAYRMIKIDKKIKLTGPSGTYTGYTVYVLNICWDMKRRRYRSACSHLELLVLLGLATQQRVHVNLIAALENGLKENEKYDMDKGAPSGCVLSQEKNENKENSG